jgi:hypothetical protein
MGFYSSKTEDTKQWKVIKFYNIESLHPEHLPKNIKIEEIILYTLSLQGIHAIS